MPTLSSVFAQSLQGIASPPIKFVGALYTLTSSQTVNDTSPTISQFTTVVYDTSPSSAFTATPSRFTMPAGVSKVRLKASVVDTASVTGQLIAQIEKNGVNTYSTNFDVESTGGDFAAAFTSAIPVVEGDYFTVGVFATASRTVDVDIRSWFSIEVVEGAILTS
jgi:hypothetical protein